MATTTTGGRKQRRNHGSVAGWSDMQEDGKHDTGNKRKGNRRKQSLMGWSAWVERGEGRGVVSTEEYKSWMLGHEVWSTKHNCKFQVQEINAQMAIGNLENGDDAKINLKYLREIDAAEKTQVIGIGRLVLAPFEEPVPAKIKEVKHAKQSAVVTFDEYPDEGAFELPFSALYPADEFAKLDVVGTAVYAPYPIYYEAVVTQISADGDRCSVMFIGWEGEGYFWLQTKELAEAPPTTQVEPVDEIMPNAEEEHKKDYLQNELEVMRQRCENLLDMVREAFIDLETLKVEKCQLAIETSKELSRVNDILKKVQQSS